jgi:hypothetical protein
MASPARGGACFRCGASLSWEQRVGRRETCTGCGADAHVCKNCDFYSSGAHNDCREPNAERVVDKERSNFCEYFALAPAGRGATVRPKAGEAATRQALDALFRKP